MIIGLLFALGAAVATGVASVLQALAARKAPASDGGSVSRLVVSPLYLSGMSFDALGFGCLVIALHWLPVFLVQCASASSVGVTAIIGRRVLGTVLGRQQLTALAGLGAGLILLAAGAKAETATGIARSAQWWFVIGVLPVIVIGVIVMQRAGDRAGGLLAAISGLVFADTGVSSRVLSDARSVHDVVIAPATYALVISGIAGTAFFAAALQRTVVTTATAALFGVDTLAASAVGLLALGDTTRHGFVVPSSVGFVLTLACALLLALAESSEGTTDPSAATTARAPRAAAPEH